MKELKKANKEDCPKVFPPFLSNQLNLLPSIHKIY